ncbi:MAG: hypothetical protein GX589_11140, partial [Deltaproteobacteria bacterium]|nr:hypothetical protein [Deltaproteobacteria bacterium]
FVMTFYMEWQSPDFKGFEGELFQFPFLIIALTLLVGRPNLLGWRFFEVLTLLIFTHLGLGAVRMLPFFGIVVALPLAQCLVNLGHARILETSQMWRRVRKAFSNLEIRERRSTKGYVLLAVLSLVLLWEAGFSGRVPLFRGVYGPQPTSYPFEALTVLKGEAAAADAPLVVINHMDWGSFISFFGGGKVKAVIDDRTTMLGEEFYYEYFDRMRPASDWRGYIEKLGGTHVLIRSSSQLAREIKSQEGFKILHEDELSTLFKVPRERE